MTTLRRNIARSIHGDQVTTVSAAVDSGAVAQWRCARCCQVVARCDNVPGWTLDIFLLKLSQDRKQGADCGLLAREFLEQFLSTVPAVSRHIRWLVAVTMQSPTHGSHQQSLAMLPASIS